MNIGFPNAASSSTQVDKQKPAQSANTGATQAAVNSGVSQTTPEVSLSQTGVQALKAQLANVPSIRQERVQALQKSVENGTYKPSNQEIASAIHSDLFGAPSNTGA
ncbi:MAG TPA: flagellar biosynthesis anti-sigma factor FlgM [Terriglobia bacterium]|nr:flagellar biosynthesis anti-sigma factor FlgM [Terriglobia bacterium]